MKKYIIALILLAVSFMLTPFSYQYIEANEIQKIETIYPENILDYVNLENISSFDICDNYIAYTLDKSTLTIFDINHKSYKQINGFNNIIKIKFTTEKIIVADNSFVRIVNLNNITNTADDLEKISEITINSLQALDIYVTDNKVLIGTISNNVFRLYEYSNTLSKTKTNPIKTTLSQTYFETAYMMAINNNNAYIIYKTNEIAGTTGLYIQNYSSNEPVIVTDFKTFANIIDTFYYNDTEYIITFTNEILYLLNSDGSSVCNINIEPQNKLILDHYPILKVTDINYYNNKIYVSDCIYKTIQTFDINEDDDSINLISNEIILCSNSNSKGRFDNVSDIYIQGSTIFTSDSNNNRIHYIQNNKSYFINDLEVNSNPHSTIVDKFNNLYFIKDSAQGSILCKYNYIDGSYIKQTEYKTVDTLPIGFISDMCITNNNNIYLLDYTNNKLLYMSHNGVESIKKFSAFTLKPNSQIVYLKGLDQLAILNNSIIYLINQKGTDIDSICVDNCNEITVDFNKIYAKQNNTIKLISIINGELIVEEDTLYLDQNSNISKISFDIINRKMIAFDNKRSCLVKFDCDLADSPFSTPNIESSNPLKTSDTIIALNIKYNYIIYELPYELGNYYNLDNSIKSCIAIGEYQDYYEILFNNNETLQIGYIQKVNTEIIEHNYKPINVIATNDIVPIYKYPTLLKYNNQRLITKEIPINTKLTLSYLFPISIDEKSFYMLKQQDEIGFVFSVDIVLDEKTNIQNLNTENATIKILDEQNSITLFESDKSTEIMQIDNKTRIYVENYDKDSEYTLVIYKDSDLNTHQGYVETKYIQMDKLDNSELILIVIIIISIILLILIAIAYIVIRKKNK